MKPGNPQRVVSTATEVGVQVLDMSAVTALTDWRSISTGRHNVLIEGTPAATATVLACLTPYLDAPVTWTLAGALFDIPSARDAGALVLQDITSLSEPQQGRLREWLNESPGRQVISTTYEPLFRLVAAGQFDETLYYRLNVILLRLPSDYPSSR